MGLIIAWDTKRDAIGMSGGFYTRCEKTVPGALHNTKSLTDGRKNDYWEYRVGKVRGRLIWVDKVTGTYGYQLKAAFINETGDKIHVINQSYNAGNAATLIGKLKNLMKEKVDLLTEFIDLTYSVYQKKDFNTRALKFKEDGSPDIKTELSMVANSVVAKDWFVYADKNKTAEERKAMGAKPIEMEWIKFKNSKGKDDWNTDVEDKFWDDAIKNLQIWLVEKNACVLPLTLGSVICGVDENATGVKQDNEFIEKVKVLYAANSAKFQWSNKAQTESKSADDFDPTAKLPETDHESHVVDTEQEKKMAANAIAMNAQAPLIVTPPNAIEVPPTNDISHLDDSDSLPF